MRGLHSDSVYKYNHEAALGTSHWPEMRKWFYKWKLTFRSKKRVYTNTRILAITKVQKTDNRLGYNFLDEIEVRRHDNVLYTFSEADYHRLNLDDVFYMYLLKIQGKLEHFPGSLQYDIVNSILLYTRQTVLKARVEDAQLGVESYQRRLEPKMQIEGMHNMRPFTLVRRPFGVV